MLNQKFVRQLLLFITAVFITGSSLAQSPATISGRIQSPVGDPVSNAVIRVNGENAGVSDSLGNYSINVPGDTKSVITFFHVGHQTKAIRVSPKSGEQLKRNIEMEYPMLIEANVSTEKDRDLPYVEIDPSNIQMLPGPGDGPIGMIKTGGLGVYSNNELSSGYNVRGGNFDENLIYVNDIEVYRPFLARSGQQEGMSYINGDMVQAISFSSGGFEAKYGDKMSSVLNITYRRPDRFRATVSGSLLGVGLHVEDAIFKNKLKYNIGFRYRSNNYLLSALDTKGDYKPNFIDFQGLLGYDISDRLELTLFGTYSDNNYVTVPSTRTTIFGHVQEAKQLTVYFDGQENTRYKVGSGAFTVNFKPTVYQSHKLIASFYTTEETEKFDIQGQYFLGEIESDMGSENFGQVVNTVGVGTFLNHARNKLNGLVYGVENKSKILKPYFGRKIQKIVYQWGFKYQREEIRDRLNEWNILDSSGYMLPYNGPFDTNTITLDDVIKSQVNLSSNRLTGYFQTSFAWEADSHEVDLTIGVRANYWDVNKEFLFSPRVQLAWKPNFKPGKKSGRAPDILFRLAGGIYYQAPFYRELRDLQGLINTDVKAQRSYQVVAGMDYNFKIWGRPFKFIAEAYYKYITNLNPYELDNVRIRYYAENNAIGYATGLDMKINGEFIEGLDSWFTFSLMKSEEDILDDSYVDENGNTVYPGFIPRPTDQRFMVGIFFQDHLPKQKWVRVHLNLLLGGPLPFGPPNDVRYTDVLRTPFYRRVDIGFSAVILQPDRKFKKEKSFMHHFKTLWVSFEVFNLLGINNTVSYLWIRDITLRQYAVPNYLTPRLFNVKIVAQF